jgi:chromate transporter
VTDNPLRGRATALQVLIGFLYVGCTAFGGGASAHIHNLVVRRKGWLSDTDFLEGMTLSQVLPGPNLSNLASYIGSRLAGPLGAAAATIGIILPGSLLILLLASLYFGLRGSSALLEGALNGVAAAGVGVVVSVVVRIAPAGLRSHGGIVIALAGFILVGLLRVNLVWALLSLFPLSLYLNRPAVQARDSSV